MKSKYRTVKHASEWNLMAGETDLEKKINSFITIKFSEPTNTPNDECLTEAIEVIALSKKPSPVISIAAYLTKQFMPPSSFQVQRCITEAEHIMKVIKEHEKLA